MGVLEWIVTITVAFFVFPLVTALFFGAVALILAPFSWIVFAIAAFLCPDTGTRRVR
jgi:hypothetical protein